MGLAFRAKDTHPEKTQQDPHSRIPMSEQSIPPDSVPKSDIVPETVPASEAAPTEAKTKKKFTIFKKQADARPEKETTALAEKESAPPLATLPKDHMLYSGRREPRHLWQIPRS